MSAFSWSLSMMEKVQDASNEELVWPSRCSVIVPPDGSEESYSAQSLTLGGPSFLPRRKDFKQEAIKEISGEI